MTPTKLIHIYRTTRIPGNDEKTKRAKKLLKLVSAEIDSVKTCLECHINANEPETKSKWFTMVCRELHLIIWAQRKNVKYWPAKVMSFDEKSVNVRFFGGYHKHEDVPVNKCFLYSEESPRKATRISTKKSNSIESEFKSALKVKNIQHFDFFPPNSLNHLTHSIDSIL